MNYNFLILHDVENFSATRKTHIEFTKCFERYAPSGHNFLYHRLREPATDVLRKADFHIVVLTATALAFCRYCRPRDVFFQIRDRLAFIRDLNAVKLAFPQDEYHQTNDIDELLKDWGMDVIYGVEPKHMEMFYPRSGRSAELKGVLTGYVDDNSILDFAHLSRSFFSRDFDIVQRVKMHPYFGGSLSQIKGQMAIRFSELAGKRPELRTDISTLQRDVLTNDRWFSLLGNGRFSLGCEGGCSVWDPDGIYFDREQEYLRRNPEASFEEVRNACFPEEDQRFTFSAVSPRLFESSLMGCSQILVVGEYLGVLKPWEHYIPVRSDLSDIEDALDSIGDLRAAEHRVAACHETLILDPKWRYSTLVKNIMEDVDRLVVGRGFKETPAARFHELVVRHRSELARMPSIVLRRAWARLTPSFRKLVPMSVRRLGRRIIG